MITSNRGLCGAFNSAIYKKSLDLIQQTHAGKKVDILAIGKKGNDLLAKENNVISNKSEIFDDLHFNQAAEIAEHLMEIFVDETYDQIEIVYNKFKNAATQIQHMNGFYQ